jgi:hypothetical protein
MKSRVEQTLDKRRNNVNKKIYKKIEKSMLTMLLLLDSIASMDIRKDLLNFLNLSGWNPNRLAKEARVSKDVIYRLVRGERKGMNSRTLEKLWPFLYGDQTEQRKEEA